MRIAVIGASGRTGRRVVDQVLRRGGAVTALARHPDTLLATASDEEAVRSGRLTSARFDVDDPGHLSDALAGCHAVVSALGIRGSRAATTVYSAGVTQTLDAMAANNIRRLSLVSALPVGPRTHQPLIARRVVLPILDLAFGATYRDMRAMEAVLMTSDLDWTCLRPPRLVELPGTGHYRIGLDQPPPRSRTLRYDDLATALLDSLQRPDLHRRAVYIAE